MSGRFGSGPLVGGLVRWLHGWRVALRIARREAWRGRLARRRSVLVTVLVGLPVLAASGYLVLIALGTLPPSSRAGALAQLPAGSQAVLNPASLGQPITQDPFGSITEAPGSTDQGAGAVRQPAAGEHLAALRERIPGADRLSVLHDGTLVASASTGADRYSVTARTATTFTGTGAGAGALEAPDPELLPLCGVGSLRAGRAPSNDREVLVTPSLAALLGLVPGSSLTLATGTDSSADRESVVVSGVADVAATEGPAVVGRPGGLPRGRVASAGSELPSGPVLVSGPEPVTWATVQSVNTLGWVALSRDVVSRSPEPRASSPGLGVLPYSGDDPAAGLLQAELIGLVLLQLVLLAAPAMAVGARRREHALAQLAVTGADRAAVRRVVLALAALMGAPGAVLGALGGVGAALAVLHLGGDLRAWGVGDVPWAGVVVLALVGIVVAVLAALVPAITAARLDPVAVLRGRRRDPRPRRRTARVGVPLVILGTAGTFLAAREAGVPTVLRAAFTVLGIAVAEIGFILALPAVLALVARAADRGPLFGRMALRDADRHRLRTVPAVAAATAAVAGSIAAQMFFTAERAEFGDGGQRYVPPQSLVLDLDLSMPLAPADAGRWRDQVLRVARPSGVSDVTPLWTLGQGLLSYGLVSRPPWGSPGATASASRVQAWYVPPPTACTVPDGGGQRGTPLLCTSASQYLRRPAISLGIAVGDGRTVSAQVGRRLPEADRALAAGRAVVTDPRLVWPDGTVRVRRWTTVDPTPSDAAGSVPRILQEFSVPAVVIDSPVLFDGVLPTAVVDRVVPALRSELRATTAIALTDRALSWFGPSTALRDQLQVLAPAGFPYGPDHTVAIQQAAMLAFAALVTLFGAASAVALAAAEGRADSAVLAAVGAAPRTRRSLAAMQALTIAGLGSAGGVVSGLLAGWALVQERATARLGVSSVSGPGVVVYGSWPTDLGADVGGWHVDVPWADVVGLGIVLPLALAGIAYLFTRSRLPTVRRPT